MSSVDHSNKHHNQMMICDYCQGSGQKIEYIANDPNEPKIEDCPKCNGEGVILQEITIITRPITEKDKVYFRKIING